jgi:hypothetical protein
MVQVLVHGWCNWLYGTGSGTCLMCMVWYKLWYLVDVYGWFMIWYRFWHMVDMCFMEYGLMHILVMVLVSMWVDFVIVSWWWYISDRDSDRDSNMLNDWLIISYILMWQWQVDVLVMVVVIGWSMVVTIWVYTYISRRLDGAGKGGCSLLSVGAAENRELEPVN